MTTIWNQHLLSHMADGSISFNAANLGLALVYSYAIPTNTSPDNFVQLLQSGGFQELDAGSGYTRIPKTTNTQVTAGPPVLTKVAITSDYALTLTVPTFVAAGVFYLSGTQGGFTDPWVFITDDMFGNVVSPGAIVGIAATPKVIFSYVIRGTTVDLSLGTLVQSPGPSTWESARIQHVYLYPQRVNYIANPSFEAVSMFGWRSDGALSRLLGGVDKPNANYFGRTAGKVVQALSVPTQGRMRFSVYVRKALGTHVQLGLVCLDESYNVLTTSVGQQRPLYADWARYDDLLVPSDDCVAVIPQILSDGTFDFDLCLLEATDPLHDYFAGDSQTGAPNDFTWQGTPHQSYSCYYNNRHVTAARLFGGYFDGQVTLPAMVNDWLPTGTAVYTHWDVLSMTDTKHPLKDWSPKIFVP
jgi:hypothetical protein